MNDYNRHADNDFLSRNSRWTTDSLSRSSLMVFIISNCLFSPLV